jgi:hypothetical protein
MYKIEYRIGNKENIINVKYCEDIGRRRIL